MNTIQSKKTILYRKKTGNYSANPIFLECFVIDFVIVETEYNQSVLIADIKYFYLEAKKYLAIINFKYSAQIHNLKFH